MKGAGTLQEKKKPALAMRPLPLPLGLAQALLMWPLMHCAGAQAQPASPVAAHTPRLVDWSAPAAKQARANEAQQPHAAAPTAPFAFVTPSASVRAASAAPAPAPAPRSRPLATRKVAQSDTQDAQSARMVLGQAVQRALAASPAVRQAEATWQASRFDVDEARGRRWPQVQVGAASPSATYGNEVSEYTKKGYGTLNVTTPLYDWGRIGSTIDSRTHAASASEAALAQARQQVGYDTASALLEFDRNRRIMVLTQAYIERLDSFVSMLARIVQSDAGRGSELTQARARRLQAITSRDQTSIRMAEARIRLVKLVGPEFAIAPRIDWESAPLPLAQALVSGAEHPSLRQARAESQAARDQAKAVGAQRYPQLNWVIAKSTQRDNFGNSLPWSTGLAVQWNAFEGGSASASERAAYARANASEQRARDAERDLEYRLRTAAEQRDAASRRATEFDSLVLETDKVRKAYFDQWFHLGKRTLLDVLTAESDHYNNRVAGVNTRFEAYTASIEMRADSATLMAWLFGTEAPAPAEEEA